MAPRLALKGLSTRKLLTVKEVQWGRLHQQRPRGCCQLGLGAKWGLFPILLPPLGMVFKVNFFCYFKISYYAF